MSTSLSAATASTTLSASRPPAAPPVPRHTPAAPRVPGLERPAAPRRTPMRAVRHFAEDHELLSLFLLMTLVVGTTTVALIWIFSP